MNTEQLQQMKILVFSHFETTGAAEELRDWLLLAGKGQMIYVAFPFGDSRNRRVTADLYREGSRERRCTSPFEFSRPQFLAYGRDFLYAISHGVRFGRGADLLVAGDNLLTLAALFLRRMRVVRRVVYYMIDFTPRRFANPFAEAVYRRIDRWAAHGADQVWPLTNEMIEARFAAGHMDRAKVNWQMVPYGSHPVKETAIQRRDRDTIVYVGGLIEGKGVELFVPVARALRERGIEFSFLVIGAGPYLHTLTREIAQAGIQDCFELAGYVDNITDVVRRAAACSVALAPYPTGEVNSFTNYADPGKLKLYLGCGLPMVLTAVPPIAKQIEAAGAGVIAEYSASDFADKIADLLSPARNASACENARRMGIEYDWDTVLRRAFRGLPGSAPGGALPGLAGDLIDDDVMANGEGGSTKQLD